MKIVVYAPDGIANPVILAVAKKYDDLGFKVTLISCNRSFKVCSYNLSGDRFVCRYCIGRRRVGINALGESNISFVDIDNYFIGKPIYESIDNSQTFESLAKRYYKGVDVGFSSLSTIISEFREYNLENYSSFQQNILRNIFKSSILYTDTCDVILEKEKPDLVCLFNGRCISTRPMVRLCALQGIKCEVYEVTQKDDKVVCFEDSLPHDSHVNYNKSIDFWNSYSTSKYQIAHNFFQQKKVGNFVNDTVYIDRQSKNNLPTNLCRNKTNIVFFNSSQDELIAIGNQYAFGIYKSQAHAVSRICESLDSSNYHIYLRIHPNLEGIKADHVSELLSLDGRYNNLTVILPNSKVSSYALLEAADFVLTFGSTIGVEATYWGKCSILLNKALWDDHDIAYKPNSHEDVINAILSKSTPKNQMNTLPLGLYWSKYGDSIEYYSGDRFQGYKINCIKCEPSFFLRLAYIFYKYRIRLHSGHKIFYRSAMTKFKRILSS